MDMNAFLAGTFLFSMLRTDYMERPFLCERVSLMLDMDMTKTDFKEISHFSSKIFTLLNHCTHLT